MAHRVRSHTQRREARGNPSVRPIGVTMPARARRTYSGRVASGRCRGKGPIWNLPLPLVVAIQVIEEFRIAKVDVMNGLFGQEAITVDTQGNTVSAGFRTELGFRRQVLSTGPSAR